MNKNSYIALLIAFLIGAALGAFVMKSITPDCTADTTAIDSVLRKHQLKVDSLHNSIAKRDSLIIQKRDSIEQLEFKLKVAKAQSKQRREEAAKLNVKQKEQWLISRYDSLQSDSVVSIPDTVAALVIDDLIVKDGLVSELAIKESIIAGLKSTIFYHELNEQDFKAAEAEFTAANESLYEHNQELQKDLKKQRKINKILKIGGAVGIGLVLLLSN